jgi:hypothetical protein
MKKSCVKNQEQSERKKSVQITSHQFGEAKQKKPFKSVSEANKKSV